MRQQGKLRTWNDERGFGFIAPTGGGAEVFVHISALPRDGSRPTLGEELSYELGSNAQGKPQALRVQRRALAGMPLPPRRPAAAAPRKPTSGRGAGRTSLLLIPVFLLLVVGLASAGRLPRWALGLYAGMSLLCFLSYGFDKAAATAGRWRTPEANLHFLALLGGWPGALLAQVFLRHKSQKAEFRAVFWVTVVLNLALLTAWALGWLPVLLPRG